MGGWWDAYSFRCQPVEHENYGRPMRVSFSSKIKEMKENHEKKGVLSKTSKNGSLFKRKILNEK